MKLSPPLAAVALVLAATLAVGCSNTKKPAANSAVTDIRPSNPAPPPPPPPVVQPIQPAQPVQPVISDSAPVVTQTISTPTPSVSGSTYTIQKGDTLYKIARAKYGNPTAVKKIIEANPGMDPNKIKVGQKINLPS
jgi:5'-nucleotidase/UDP-sugar diphosphatase